MHAGRDVHCSAVKARRPNSRCAQYTVTIYCLLEAWQRVLRDGELPLYGIPCLAATASGLAA